jgi:circadian clock protein KaiC
MPQVSEPQRVRIRQLPTGVPGLDDVLGGGIPEFSFNVLAGAPGTGKTTLAQQILFANATPARPGLFFTVLGEPPIKMLRYQQQFRFFDPARVGADVHFLNLSEEVLDRNPNVVLERITADVERLNPAIVVVDSFRTVVRATGASTVSELEVQHFVQRLALRLTSWEATTFLIGEFADGESRDPVFTVADGVLWLANEVERNSTVRKLRVTKVRGQAAQPGLHSMRITDAGVEVYPRLPDPPSAATEERSGLPARCSIGIPELDAMLGGGIPAGDSVLVTGPTGTGKTMLATQFAAEGVRRGECAVIAVFEEHPAAYVERARSLGFDLRAMTAAGKLDVMYLRPLDLSVDETLQELRTRIARLGATRVVIDSLSGFEAALAPTFRQDFRESFHRMMISLTTLGITILSIVEVSEASDYLRFSPYNISFLTDDIVAMRYVELEGELRKVISVIKMRGSDHSRALRAYDVTGRGLVMRETLHQYRGILTGVPERRSGVTDLGGAELSATETSVLDVLLRVGETSEEVMANETGLSVEQIQQAFGRLVAVRHIRGVVRGGRTLYRAEPRTLR